jgi:hypothetical protein
MSSHISLPTFTAAFVLLAVAACDSGDSFDLNFTVAAGDVYRRDQNSPFNQSIPNQAYAAVAGVYRVSGSPRSTVESTRS